MPLKPWATCLPVWTAQVHIAEGLSILSTCEWKACYAKRDCDSSGVGASHNSAGLCNEVLIYGRGGAKAVVSGGNIGMK